VQDRDLFAFEEQGRQSTTSSVGGHGQIQEELRYTTEPDEAAIESPVMRDLQYASLMTHDQQAPPTQQAPPPQAPPPYPGHVDRSSPVFDDRPRDRDNIAVERKKRRQEKPSELEISPPGPAVCLTLYRLKFVKYDQKYYIP